MALAIGQWFGLQGMARLGALHVLQPCTGLRPSELLNLKQSDLRPFWLNVGHGQARKSLISFGDSTHNEAGAQAVGDRRRG